jgi:hypothetical protein
MALGPVPGVISLYCRPDGVVTISFLSRADTHDASHSTAPSSANAALQCSTQTAHAGLHVWSVVREYWRLDTTNSRHNDQQAKPTGAIGAQVGC